MLEARAHAGPGSSEAESVASTLQLALGDALQGDMGPVERSHALSALIWAQAGPLDLCWCKATYSAGKEVTGLQHGLLHKERFAMLSAWRQFWIIPSLAHGSAFQDCRRSGPISTSDASL